MKPFILWALRAPVAQVTLGGDSPQSASVGSERTETAIMGNISQQNYNLGFVGRMKHVIWQPTKHKFHQTSRPKIEHQLEWQTSRSAPFTRFLNIFLNENYLGEGGEEPKLWSAPSGTHNGKLPPQSPVVTCKLTAIGRKFSEATFLRGRLK